MLSMLFPMGSMYFPLSYTIFHKTMVSNVISCALYITHYGVHGIPVGSSHISMVSMLSLMALTRFAIFSMLFPEVSMAFVLFLPLYGLYIVYDMSYDVSVSPMGSSIIAYAFYGISYG